MRGGSALQPTVSNWKGSPGQRLVWLLVAVTVGGGATVMSRVTVSMPQWFWVNRVMVYTPGPGKDRAWN